MPEGSFIKLPLLAQTTYAGLLDLLLTSEAGDPAAGTTLVSKNIRGRRYWYAQRHEAGKKLQSYIGPETPEIATMIERWRCARGEAADRSELVAMARAGGAHVATVNVPTSTWVVEPAHALRCSQLTVEAPVVAE